MSIRAWQWDRHPPREIALALMRETRRLRKTLTVFLLRGYIHLVENPDSSKDWLFSVGPRTSDDDCYAMLMEAMDCDAQDRVKGRRK